MDKHTDVLVVGGGAAGVAAAVAAARNGLSVTLLERNAYLGGKATAAEVGTVCGLYAYSKAEKSSHIAKGFSRDFAEHLQQKSGSVPLHNAEGLHYLPYDIEAFKELCLQYLLENNVQVYLNATLENAVISGNTINSVGFTSAGESIEYTVKSVIDCSGDAVISRSANLETLSSQEYQAAAQVFTLENISETNEARLGLILMKALRQAIDNNLLPDFYDRVYIVQGSLHHNSVSLKLGIPVSITYEKGNMETVQQAAMEFIQTLTGFLVKNVEVFKNASIRHIADEVGTRVGARTMGKYILTETDVLACRKFEDAVANGSWPIEEWEQHKRVKMRFFQLDDFYQVPAGCLQSLRITNLFMAGRNISATDTAIASARVMGTCLQTGYAAGCMAAGFVKKLGESTVIKSIQKQQL